jgi:hypothetical protein
VAWIWWRSPKFFKCCLWKRKEQDRFKENSKHISNTPWRRADGSHHFRPLWVVTLMHRLPVKPCEEAALVDRMPDEPNKISYALQETNSDHPAIHWQIRLPKAKVEHSNCADLAVAVAQIFPPLSCCHNVPFIVRSPQGSWPGTQPQLVSSNMQTTSLYCLLRCDARLSRSQESSQSPLLEPQISEPELESRHSQEIFLFSKLSRPSLGPSLLFNLYQGGFRE